MAPARGGLHVKRSEDYKGKCNPLGADGTRALRWYWNQLRWRAGEEDAPGDVGVSWKELAVDFWLASGVTAKGPKGKGRSTSLQQVAEAFASASQVVEVEQKKGGQWLWCGVCGRTSSLALFGQRAAVAGLKRRPRLAR
jgi:hypothetical protein